MLLFAFACACACAAADAQGSPDAPAKVPTKEMVDAGWRPWPGHGPTGTIYVIRHGEKIKTGDHLNATGLARAQYVAKIFGGGPGSKHTPPKAIFANFRDQEYNSIELVTPLAKRLGIRVNDSYHRPTVPSRNNTEASDAMLAQLAKTGGPVLTAWESYNIVPVVWALGCNATWIHAYTGWYWGHGENKRRCFDRFLIAHFVDGQCVDVQMEYEGFKNWETWAVPPSSKDPQHVLHQGVSLILAVCAVAIFVRASIKLCWGRSKPAAAREPLLPE